MTAMLLVSIPATIAFFAWLGAVREWRAGSRAYAEHLHRIADG